MSYMYPSWIKNGQKYKTPIYYSSPRQVPFADFMQMTAEEKMGSIICPDVPVPDESDYVEVVADGVKTNATLLNELFVLADRSRTNQGSVLIRNGIFHYCIQTESSVVVFTSGYVDTSASGSLMVTATLQASNSKLEVCKLNGTYTNNSSSVPTIGSTFRIYYNDAHTFDFNTKAENCIYDNSNVKDALDAVKLRCKKYTITLADNQYATPFGTTGSIPFDSYVNLTNLVSVKVCAPFAVTWNIGSTNGTDFDLITVYARNGLSGRTIDTYVWYIEGMS